jgi:hypothetical protein
MLCRAVQQFKGISEERTASNSKRNNQQGAGMKQNNLAL